MTLRHFVALLSVEASGTCRVVFPDLPGCTSAGRNLQHAAEQAAEALAMHIDGLVEDDHPVPHPSAPDAALPGWLTGAEPRTTWPLLVGVDVPSRAVRINLMIEETLLGRLDAAAAAEGCTRGAYVALAVRARLRQEVRSVEPAKPLGTADVLYADLG